MEAANFGTIEDAREAIDVGRALTLWGAGEFVMKLLEDTGRSQFGANQEEIVCSGPFTEARAAAPNRKWNREKQPPNNRREPPEEFRDREPQ